MATAQQIVIIINLIIIKNHLQVKLSNEEK